MMDDNQTVLDTQLAIGTFTECLAAPGINGAFDDYQYCVANGRKVLLGYRDDSVSKDITGTPEASATAGPVNYVFVSRDKRHYRSVYTWEELRAYLQAGGHIGSVRAPGISIWFVNSGRNARREPDLILVLRAPVPLS
ncbi:MAG TPA: hypothetical protein VGK81_11215 [Anaerolineae bacterium]